VNSKIVNARASRYTRRRGAEDSRRRRELALPFVIIDESKARRSFPGAPPSGRFTG